MLGVLGCALKAMAADNASMPLKTRKWKWRTEKQRECSTRSTKLERQTTKPEESGSSRQRCACMAGHGNSQLQKHLVQRAIILTTNVLWEFDYDALDTATKTNVQLYFYGGTAEKLRGIQTLEVKILKRCELNKLDFFMDGQQQHHLLLSVETCTSSTSPPWACQNPCEKSCPCGLSVLCSFESGSMAGETISWPGMTGEIKDMIVSCPTCNEYQPLQPAERLMTPAMPTQPSSMDGIDLCSLDSQDS